MPDTTFIYGLVEPDTGKLRYVGKANDPQQRFGKHLRDTQVSHKTCWIKGLQSRGLVPRLEVLLEVSELDWQFWERDMISTFRWAGHDLVNSTDGGDGLDNPSDEIRKKIGDKSRGRKHTEAHKHSVSLRMLGHTHNRGKRRTDEQKSAQSERQRGRKRSPEFAARRREVMLGKQYALGVKRSPETLKRMSVARFRYLVLKHSEKFFV